jgi:uncharacterized protein YjbI with pentapeptide repeats
MTLAGHGTVTRRGCTIGEQAPAVMWPSSIDLGMLDDERRDLRADCGRCAGLCCVAPGFAASADFAIDKPAGRPCPNLGADFSCSIHGGLRERGFPGCAVFDCFGAGQRVVQVTFGGADWRQAPEVATSMFGVFTVMRQLHQLLWYLAEATVLMPAGVLHDDVERAQARTQCLTAAVPDDLAALDIARWRREVGPLLERISEVVRGEVRDRQVDRTGADLMGAKLRGADLHGASLRGAQLIGADLRNADLRWTDLLEADLRAADLRGANLDQSIFLTQMQLDAARGDASTTIPPPLLRPGHWSASARSVGRPINRPRGRRGQ